MLLAFALALSSSLSAAPGGRLNYESKCLYCHSEEVAEGKRYTEAGWRRVIEQMRKKAPLLITRTDVVLLARYMAQTLKLVPLRAAEPAPEVANANTTPEVRPFTSVVPAIPPPPLEEPPLAASEEPSPAAIALEQQVASLMQHRCSKCHTLSRVYGRLDTLDRSLSTLERMRLKTGSGITDDEMKLMEEYLRAQF
jgi:hypothetical protein